MKENRSRRIEEILEEHKKYYENLLKTRQSEAAEETQIQCKVEKEFQQNSKGKNCRNHIEESN